MKICLLDPGIENNNHYPSANLGDLIIQESINREIINIFGQQDIVRFSTHVPLENDHFKILNTCSIILVGGTNLLSSYMNKYNQWKIWINDALRIKTAILLGVGWWQYQGNPNLYTKILLRAALSKKSIHSVRDNYSKVKLQSLGINNVLNTVCPTMWPLASFRNQDIPYEKSENALLMVTDYSKNIELDIKLIELLFSKYKKVFLWPQGRGDIEYVLGMNFPVTMLEHSLEALDKFISSGIAFDYIGTRLHGGIRCLVSRKRSLILEIDNRAKEIASDTGLPTSARSDFDYISQWINGQTVTNIKIDPLPIKQWKSQFKIENGNIF